MNRTSHLPILLAVLSTVGVGTISGGSARAQKPTPPAEIVELSTSVLIPVEFEIRARTQHLFFPICGKDDLGKYRLCAFDVLAVERFDGTKWVRIKPGYPGEVFGIEAESKYVDLAPGEHAGFLFDLNPEFRHVHKGDKLRLSVSYWNDLQTMNKGREAGKLFSPTFVCP